MTATTMPTSGTARRRAKAARNRARAYYELESAWAVLNDRIPPSAIAASVCPCGYRAWLMPGATAEDRESFDRDNDDHATYCEAS